MRRKSSTRQCRAVSLLALVDIAVDFGYIRRSEQGQVTVVALHILTMALALDGGINVAMQTGRPRSDLRRN